MPSAVDWRLAKLRDVIADGEGLLSHILEVDGVLESHGSDLREANRGLIAARDAVANILTKRKGASDADRDREG